MKCDVLIKCSMADYEYLLKRIIKNNIDIKKSYDKNNEHYLILNMNNYDLLNKLDYKNSITFVNYTGLYNVINKIKSNILYIIVTLVIITLIYFSNNLIIKVNIHTGNVDLSSKLRYYLMDNQIKNFSIKQNYNKLLSIKNKALKKFKNEIEWLEIVPNGYEYDIYLIERKNKSINIKQDRCNYVAKKSGTITKIKASKGVIIVQENNYVNKGDILIQGQIIYDNEIKNEICAQGKIYGEVWYEVDISYPLSKTYIYEKKNKFYNFVINLNNKKYIVFNDKNKNKKVIKKIGSDNIGIDIYSSYKIVRKNKLITEEEAIRKSLNKIKKNIMIKSNNKSRILSQNILKKYVNNGTIYLKVLVTCEEEIGVVENY